MTPNHPLQIEPSTLAVQFAKLQSAVDEERRENSVHRLDCRSDCKEHFPMRLLASFTQSVTRVESWG